jgi:hypothetical protein
MPEGLLCLKACYAFTVEELLLFAAVVCCRWRGILCAIVHGGFGME